MKALHYVGGGLCVAASILISNAVLTFSALPECGSGIGAPACPDSVNLAAGEMVGGFLILIVGAFMTIGIGLLIALVCAGIYSLVRTILGVGGPFSSASVIVAGFLALPVLIVTIRQVRLTIDYRRADNTTGHALHDEVVSPQDIPRRGDRVTVLYDPSSDETVIDLIGLAPAPNPMIVDAGPQDAVPPGEPG